MNNRHIKDIEVKQFSDEHTTTEADRRNDELITQWKARRIEECRRILASQLARQQRDRAAACVDAYAKRIGGAA